MQVAFDVVLHRLHINFSLSLRSSRAPLTVILTYLYPLLAVIWVGFHPSTLESLVNDGIGLQEERFHIYRCSVSDHCYSFPRI